MAIKTFNIDHETYKKFAEHCKQSGISMSKKVENFIRGEIDKIGKTVFQNERVNNPLVNQDEHSFKKYC